MSHPGRIPIYTKTLDYSGTNVDATNWVQLTSALASDITRLEIRDGGTKIMELGIGAAGSEQRYCLITNGGVLQIIDAVLNKGMRLSIRAVDATASTGFLQINGFI